MPRMRWDFKAGDAPPATWPFTTGGGALISTDEGLRLNIPQASERIYADAQLDDFHGRPRNDYPWRPPVTLRLEARFSHQGTAWPGTAGFGFWNAPFVGERAGPLALRAPDAVWFFLAGPPARLAFAPRRGWEGRGFFAQSLALDLAPGFPGLLWGGALAVAGYLPTRAILPASLRARVAEAPLPHIDPTAWHRYEVDWQPTAASLRVDGQTVLHTASPPVGPLALVIWVDNQWAALGPPLGYQGGLHPITAPLWLDLRWVEIEAAHPSPEMASL